MRVYDFDLSMKQQHILQTGIILVADDEKSNKLNATLIDTDELDNLDEYEILWLFRKRSRESVVYTKEHIDIEGDTLSVILTAKALNVVGSVESEIKFIKGDKVYTTQPFEIYIRKPIDLVDVENELGITISDIVNRLKDINDKYEQLLATGGLSEEDKAKVEKALKDTADMKKEVTEILNSLEDTNIESLLDNIEEFREELTDLSNHIINHYEDIQHLTSNVIDINNTLTHTYSYIGIIKDDIKNTKDKLISLEFAHKQLCEAHENDVSSIKEYINNILDDYESVINDIDNINVSLNLLEDVDVELKEDLSALNKAIDLCKSDIQANQNLINNINTKVNSNYQTTKENLNSINNDIEKINNNINKMNKNISQQVDNIDKLVSNINNVKVDVSTINTTINGVNSDIEDLQALYKELLDSLSNISIPTKLSDLEDDVGYVTKSDLDDIDIEIPTLELDEIKNDITLIKKHNIKQDEYLQNVATNEDIEDFITLDDLPDVDFSSIEEQVGVIKAQIDDINIPTSISELENDSGFITIEDVPEVDLEDVYNTISNVANNVNKQIKELPKHNDIPNSLSDLNNDVGYITLDDVPKVDLSDLKDSINNINNQINEFDIPTALSELNNDIGYITLDDVPEVDLEPINKKINDLKSNLNDEISQLPTQEEIPTHLSELENDTKFITKDIIPFDDIEKNKINIQKVGFDIENIHTLLNNKVDKITGKGLSTNDFTNALKDKLNNIEHGANYYEHPNTHSANIIEETDNRQFVSLKDKQKWDRKATQEDVDNINNKLSNANDKLDSKLDIKTAETLYENKSNKGVAGGYVPLNDKGQVPLHHLPDISKHQLFIVDNDDDKGNLKANKGDTVYIINTGDSYIYDGSKWVVLAKADWENVNLDWFNIINAPKSSVDDIDKAVKDKHIHSNKDVLDSLSSDDVDKWNGAYKHTLNKDIHVSLDEKEYWNNKVNTADLDSLKNTINQNINDMDNKYNKIKENLEQKADNINVKEQLNKLQVDVNNKAPLLHNHSEYEKQLTTLEGKIPTKVSDLENNRGFITLRDIPKESVTSVNSKQGRVELFAGDIRYRLLSSSTIYDKIEELFSDINSLKRGMVDKDYIQQALKDTVESINGMSGKHIELYGDNIKIDSNSSQTIEEVIKNKANIKHNHTTEDIVETSNKQFISANEKEQINTIQNKANKKDIPTKIGELENDKGFITADEVPQEGVTSINNQKGDVVLTGSNIHIDDDTAKTIKEELDYIEGVISNKVNKGSVVTSINGKQGDVELSGDDIKFNQWNSITEELRVKANVWDLLDKADKKDVVTSINDKKGDVALTGSDINVSDGIDVSIDEVMFELDDILEEKANKTDVEKELNNKIEWINNVSGKRITLYGNMIDTKWGSNKTITEALEGKVNKNDVVTSVNGQKGDVVIDVDKVDLSKLEEDIDNLAMSKADKIHSHSANDIVETADRRFVNSRHLSDINTISYLHKNKSDKEHTHNINEFVHVGSDKPTDGRLWIEI